MCGITLVCSLDGSDVTEIGRRLTVEVGNRGNHGAGMILINTRRRSVDALRHTGPVAGALRVERFTGLQSDVALGQTRYPTQGSITDECTQPYAYAETALRNGFYLSHNGNVANTHDAKHALGLEGIIPRNDVDTETIGQTLGMILEKNGDKMLPAIEELCKRFGPAMNLLITRTDGESWAYRHDGFHPLSYTIRGKMIAFASEDSALRRVLGEETETHDLEPGYAMQIPVGGPPILHRINATPARANCLMEFIYMSDSDTVIDGTPVATARRNWALAMAQQDEHLRGGNYTVIGVPNSGLFEGEVYAKALGLELNREALTVRPHADRTFIDAGDRLARAREKFMLRPELLKGKRVILVEDSIVRSTTLQALIPLLDAAGVEEILIRSCAPPVVGPCPYGIAIGTRNELFAAQFSTITQSVPARLPKNIKDAMVERLRQMSESHRGENATPSRLTSVEYLPNDELERALNGKPVCRGCFSNIYPEPLGQQWADNITGRLSLPLLA